MIFPQPLLIFLCLAIPTYLIYIKKNHIAMVGLIAVAMIVDIFNSQLYMNLAAILLFGIAVIPYVWMNRTRLIKNKSTWAFAAYFLLLILLGIYHGFLSPWPDVTGHRSIKDQAQVRSILHLGRTFLEYCVMLYLVLQIELQPKKTLNTYLKIIFGGSLALCVGAVLERVMQWDFYHFFTGGRAYIMDFRSRSLAYEPRGLSQNLAHAILLTPFTPFASWKYFAVILFLIFGFWATFSFSGIMVLGVGAGALVLSYLLIHRDRIQKYKNKIFAGSILLMVGMGLVYQLLPPYPKYYLSTHLAFLKAPNIAEKLEIYDAASINFLNHNPKYYLLGTGPGLVYLPATNYIVERDLEVFHGGFEALPHMGSVLILSNAGLIGLAIFLSGVFIALRRKKNLRSDYVIIGCILTVIFLFQIRYFYLFGLASLIAEEGTDEK